MTSRIIHSCAHGVLGIDTSADPWLGLEAAFAPSQDLLARARAGWQRFTDSLEEPCDD
ncbi:hypothetical protein [Streptomyces sp. NBC_00091]|uniref:hypothetical protein n=1 Tax=Streptomyces sp. NBC_00091 TaxID=2975648 RepID=UPI00224FC141|nr:hypothetical protein [Streptomyces sp. NBC_00091]MCX5378104.1 hypothetical protein [Streptomyces sp. NBC_00091]